jgi:Flp pilus assembly protein TadG
MRAHVRRRGRGQSLVEFALVLPMFLLLLFGIIDMGRYVFMNSVLSQAAREGARLASVEASWVGSTDVSCGTAGGAICPASVTTLRTHIRDAANRMTAPFGDIPASAVFVRCDASATPAGAWTDQTCITKSPGARASVRVVMTFTPITPIISSIVGTLTTSASTTMVIN